MLRLFMIAGYKNHTKGMIVNILTPAKWCGFRKACTFCVKVKLICSRKE